MLCKDVLTLTRCLTVSLVPFDVIVLHLDGICNSSLTETQQISSFTSMLFLWWSFFYLVCVSKAMSSFSMSRSTKEIMNCFQVVFIPSQNVNVMSSIYVFFKATFHSHPSLLSWPPPLSPLPQVVQRIKAVDHETRLLVVDRETDEMLRSLRLTATEEMAIRVTGSPSAASPPPSPSPAPSSTPSSPSKKRENGSVSKQPLTLSSQVPKPTQRSPSRAAKKVRWDIWG